MNEEQLTIIILKNFVGHITRKSIVDNFSGIDLKKFAKSIKINHEKWHEIVLNFLEKNTNTKRPLIIGKYQIYKTTHRVIRCKNHKKPVSIPPNKMRNIENVVCQCGKNVELISSVFYIE